jgi:DNA repair protein RecO (recombination protein O)
MIFKTRGIVFRFTKFKETSIIVNIFTDVFGLQSYIVNGVRSKSAKNKIALYQPLTLLNLVVYHRPNANIERIKEISCLYPYQSLTTDVKKSTIAMFITELLNKTVKDESHARETFDFLSESFIAMDSLKEGFENFHLIFMLKLCRYLGFGISNVNEILGGRLADPEIEKLLLVLVTAEYTTPLPITNVQRRVLLDHLLKFYTDHMENLGEMKSIQVLKDVLM